MKIRTGFGDLDLGAYRLRIAGVSDEDCEAEAVLDALEAVLKLRPHPGLAPERNTLLRVREAAGVIEEQT